MLDHPSSPGLLTLGGLARRLKRTTNWVEYAVSEYDIQPAMRAGDLRLRSEQDLPRIKSAPARIAANGGGR